MIRFYLICISLCGLCLTNIDGQTTVNNIFKTYQEEQLSFERAYFEAISNADTSVSTMARQENLNEILLKKVYSHKKFGNFQAANEAALRLDLVGMADSIQYKYRKEIVVTFYLQNKFEDAHNQIIQHKLINNETTFKNKFDFWEILTLANLKKYKEADSLFYQYCNLKNILIKKNEIDFEKNVKTYNIKKAKFLATVLPGAGMIYLGKTKEGIFSLGLQALSLGWGVHNILNKYYASGFFTGFGLFQTFYFGGIKRSEILAKELNETQSQKITNSYLEKLLEIEKGN